jgi:DNA invertase Pin-like site-specific DNA recombinase
MQSRAHAADRLVGVLIGASLLATLPAAPPATAAQSEPQTSSTAASLKVGGGYTEPRGSDRVRTLQRDLRTAGGYAGAIDGRFGPRTEDAIRRFQAREGLPVDGVADEATVAAIERSVSKVRNSRSRAQPHRAAGGGSRASTPGSRPSESSGNGITAEGAIALAAGVALVSGLLTFTLTRRAHRREPTIPTAAAAQAGADGSERTLPAESIDGRRFKPPVFGYASVDAQLDGVTREDFRLQAQAIASECKRRGLGLLELVREREPRRGTPMDRPALSYALKRISAGEADGLVVAELSRLSRSVPDLGPVLVWFLNSNARLVAAAQGLDTEERGGRLAVRTLIDAAGWERQRLIERTRKGMSAARRKGPPGVADHPKLRERIARMRAEGMTLQAISDRLNADGVPTVRGGAKWRPSSVQAAAGYKRPRAGVVRRGSNGDRTDMGGT